jgi:hypothetical protein
MPITYAYPTAGEFKDIEREKITDLTMTDPAFTHFPIRERQTTRVTWRQKDNTTGVQQIRGVNGEPPRVVPLGENFFSSQAGYYGEYMPIDEEQLTTRTDVVMGNTGLPMPTEDMIDEIQEQLLGRRLDRIKNTIWDLMVQGYFAVRDIKNAILHTESYTQNISTGSDWSTPATSTPLADFRAINLLGRGTSANFGGGAIAYMNQVTANRMMSNTNATNLDGKHTTGGGTITSLNGWNTILEGEGLPRVVVYEGGYFPEGSTTWTLRIPDDVVVVVGTRPDTKAPGEYQMVVNANNPNRAPGAYTIVKDSADGPHPVPREIQVHDGHNGGPALIFPGMLIRMNV